MNKLTKLFKISSQEQILFFQAILLLNTVRLALFLVSFPTLRKIVDKLRNSFLLSNNKGKTPTINNIVMAVYRSARYSLGNSKCLAKAITAQTLMKAYGYSAELKIGVNKEKSGNLKAHAWVEYQDQVVIGYLKDLQSFLPITSFL